MTNTIIMKIMKNREPGKSHIWSQGYSHGKFEESKYNFTRANWQVADMWTKDVDVVEIRNWCIEHFGSLPKNQDAWCRWTNPHRSLFRFRDEDDAILFRLRWQ